MIVAVFTAGMFAYSSTLNVAEDLKNAGSTNAQVISTEEDFVCKIRNENGDVVASCLMCNCEKLLETYWEQYRENKKLDKELA